MDTLADALIEEGMAKGIVAGMERGKIEGKIEGKIDALRTVLEARFGTVSPSLTAALARIHDAAILERLTVLAVTARDLSEFEGALAAP